MRITAACPEALINDANQLAMCLAYSIADGETFRLPCGWQDPEGNPYSAASWEASDSWIAKIQQPLERPTWDTEEVIDMEAAARAQAVLMFSQEPVLADPTQLTALGGPDGPTALSIMGLSALVPSE